MRSFQDRLDTLGSYCRLGSSPAIAMQPWKAPVRSADRMDQRSLRIRKGPACRVTSKRALIGGLK